MTKEMSSIQEAIERIQECSSPESFDDMKRELEAKVIEIKCSRGNMKVKKLIEEIEADMIHYSAANIYFFVYDKEKIIENPIVLKNYLEKRTKEKQVHIIIHQPKRL